MKLIHEREGIFKPLIFRREYSLFYEFSYKNIEGDIMLSSIFSSSFKRFFIH